MTGMTGEKELVVSIEEGDVQHPGVLSQFFKKLDPVVHATEEMGIEGISFVVGQGEPGSCDDTLFKRFIQVLTDSVPVLPSPRVVDLFAYVADVSSPVFMQAQVDVVPRLYFA